jgi:hypothetical protein
LHNAWLAALTDANLALVGQPHRVQQVAILAAQIGRMKPATVALAQYESGTASGFGSRSANLGDESIILGMSQPGSVLRLRLNPSMIAPSHSIANAIRKP